MIWIAHGRATRSGTKTRDVSVRQGNQNDDVYIYRYITKGTFDSYLYQTIEKKQTFISQIFTSKTPQRTMEEVDETVLNYAEIKAIAVEMKESWNDAIWKWKLTACRC